MSVSLNSYVSTDIATFSHVVFVLCIFLARLALSRGCGRLMVIVVEGIDLLASDDNGKTRGKCTLMVYRN